MFDSRVESTVYILLSKFPIYQTPKLKKMNDPGIGSVDPGLTSRVIFKYGVSKKDLEDLSKQWKYEGQINEKEEPKKKKKNLRKYKGIIYEYF